MTKKECIAWVESHMEVKYATSNGAYRSGRKINPQGCVNHSFGVAQPSIDDAHCTTTTSAAYIKAGIAEYTGTECGVEKYTEAVEDADAMNVDQEFRLTLLELGV